MSRVEIIKEAIEKNVVLAPYSSWKVGGKAEYFFQPKTVEELVAAQEWATEHKCSVTVLSGGSNVLISDNGIPGLVIQLRYLSGIISSEIVGEHFFIEAWAGTPKSEVLKLFIKNKLMAAVFLTGLPGDLGGGVVMNAGVGFDIDPKEFCEIIEAIEVLKPNGQIEEVRELQWGYRKCLGWQPGIITKVKLKCPYKPNTETMNALKSATRRRVASQPLTEPSGGSTFRNPPGEKAGALIEACELKDFEVGGAKVSTKHANFIVTKPNSKATDVYKLIQYIQAVVNEKKKIQLRTEVVLMGEF